MFFRKFPRFSGYSRPSSSTIRSALWENAHPSLAAVGLLLATAGSALLPTSVLSCFPRCCRQNLPHGTKCRPTLRQRSFQSQDFETSDPTRKIPPNATPTPCPATTNPPGHVQEPHERYYCKTTTKPTAATHQPPATETALEGAQEPSKTVGLEGQRKMYVFYGHFFTFLTKQ